MRRLQFHSRVPVPRAVAWACYTADGMFERLTPPWQTVEIVDGSGGVAPGSWRCLRLSAGPLSLDWVALHGSWKPGFYFTDEQIEGPFARWSHVHRFADDGADASILSDEISLRLPFHGLASPLVGPVVAEQLRRMFRYRHRRAFLDLIRHAAHWNYPRMKIALAGESWMGDQLAAFLRIGGHIVERAWPLSSAPDALILLPDAIAALSSGEFSQDSASVIVAIDDAGQDAPSRPRDAASRLVWIRTGAIMSGTDGPLRNLIRAVNFGINPEIEDSTPLRWISLDDLIEAVHISLLSPRIDGELIVVAPEQLTSRQLQALVREIAGRPLLPGALEKLIGRSMRTSGVVGSVIDGPPNMHVLRAAGFRFAYPRLGPLVRVESGRA